MKVALESSWWGSNPRLPDKYRDALAKLSYAPMGQRPDPVRRGGGMLVLLPPLSIASASSQRPAGSVVGLDQRWRGEFAGAGVVQLLAGKEFDHVGVFVAHAAEQVLVELHGALHLLAQFGGGRST